MTDGPDTPITEQQAASARRALRKLWLDDQLPEDVKRRLLAIGVPDPTAPDALRHDPDGRTAGAIAFLRQLAADNGGAVPKSLPGPLAATGPSVDAGPVRAHLDAIVDGSHPLRRASWASGVPFQTLSKTYRGQTKRICQSYFDAAMELTKANLESAEEPDAMRLERLGAFLRKRFRDGKLEPGQIDDLERMGFLLERESRAQRAERLRPTIVRRLQNGTAVAAIAEDLNMTAKTVAAIAASEGLLNPDDVGREGRRKRRAEAARLLGAGRTYEEVGAQLGYSRSALEKIAKDFGVNVRTVRRRGAALKVMCLETGAEYASPTAAAGAAGVSTASVHACVSGNRRTAAGLHWMYSDALADKSPQEWIAAIEAGRLNATAPLELQDLEQLEALCAARGVKHVAAEAGVTASVVAKARAGEAVRADVANALGAYLLTHQAGPGRLPTPQDAVDNVRHLMALGYSGREIADAAGVSGNVPAKLLKTGGRSMRHATVKALASCSPSVPPSRLTDSDILKFGRIVRDALGLGLTVQDLCRETGVPASMLYKLRDGAGSTLAPEARWALEDFAGHRAVALAQEKERDQGLARWPKAKARLSKLYGSGWSLEDVATATRLDPALLRGLRAESAVPVAPATLDALTSMPLRPRPAKPARPTKEPRSYDEELGQVADVYERTRSVKATAEELGIPRHLVERRLRETRAEKRDRETALVRAALSGTWRSFSQVARDLGVPASPVRSVARDLGVGPKKPRKVDKRLRVVETGETFPAPLDAAVALFGDKSLSSWISECCRWEKLACHGLSFEWLDDPEPSRKRRADGPREPETAFPRRPVTCIDSDKDFDSIKDACRWLGLPRQAASNIGACCAGRQRQAYGHLWRYTDDEQARLLWEEEKQKPEVRLKCARMRAGYHTQRECASALGVAPSRYCRWESGEAPLPASLYGSIEELLGPDALPLTATGPRPECAPTTGRK